MEVARTAATATTPKPTWRREHWKAFGWGAFWMLVAIFAAFQLLVFLTIPPR